MAESTEAGEAAAGVLTNILRGVKNIGIYRHAEGRYIEFIEPGYRALTEFQDKHGALALKLGPYNLYIGDESVYEEQSKENLTYRFYRDGMRYLIFREGIDQEELLRFVILTVELQSETTASHHEDTITRLWKESFRSIEYVQVEGFEFGDLSAEEVEIEVEKVVAYLRQQLAANSDDVTRFARLSVEDLALQLDDIEQVRGGVVSGRPADDQTKAWIQNELFTEEKKRLFAKVVLILFQILDRDCTQDDYERMSEVLTQVLDTLILSEDVRGSVAVLHRFDQLSEKPEITPERLELLKQLRATFARRMAEPQRVEAVGNYMSLSKDIDTLAIRTYLSVLKEDSLPTLIEMLERMERVQTRQILIDLISDLGAGQPGLFAERLATGSSNVVRDMLAILDRIDPPEKLDLYAECLKHPNLMVRLEGLKVIGRSEGTRAADHVERALLDDELQVRLVAYRALAQREPERATHRLCELMLDDSFAARDKREQAAVAVALGECHSEGALEHFRMLFESKGNLFSRAKANDGKMLAIKGLLAHRSIDAFNILTAEIKGRAHPREILEAAHKAATRLRDELVRRHSEAP